MDLQDIREQLEMEEAQEKVAGLAESVYNDEVSNSLFVNALDMLEEKVANGELDMGPSSLVTLAAYLTDEALDELEKVADHEDYDDDYDDDFSDYSDEELAFFIGEDLMKEAGFDFDGIVNSGDPDLHEEATDLIADAISELLNQ